MKLKCSACGATFTSQSNFDFHKRSTHFATEKPIPVRISEGGGASGSSASAEVREAMLRIGAYDEDEPQIQVPQRVVSYHCPVCSSVLDLKEYPNLLDENQMREYHEVVESPNCRPERETLERQAQEKINDLARWREGKQCPNCGKRLFSEYSFKQHVESHKSETMTTVASSTQAPKTISEIVEILRTNGVKGSNQRLREIARLILVQNAPKDSSADANVRN